MDLLNVAEIFAVPQIIMVLVIALLLFGPKRMPELGKSIGSALRELNKAKNDMMKSFSLDHEPEPHDPYKYDNNYSADHNYNSAYPYNTPETPDLTDYTIAGIPPKETLAIEGTVARDSHGSNGYDPAASADYMIAPTSAATSSNGTSAPADTHTGAASTAPLAEAAHKGEQNV